MPYRDGLFDVKEGQIRAAKRRISGLFRGWVIAQKSPYFLYENISAVKTVQGLGCGTAVDMAEPRLILSEAKATN